ncbi:MAG TPA: hypothetical protein ENG69_00945 [Candidatus Korarchaeota archaeon]|nr:hypothetical protein [Candidatus Korarchaeota archaeon]
MKLLGIAAVVILILASFINPLVAVPGWAVLAWSVAMWIRQRRANRFRIDLLKRLLAQAESLIDDGKVEEAAGILRSAIRYELAKRLSLPPSAGYEQVALAAPPGWGALLERGTVEELVEALKTLVENPP